MSELEEKLSQVLSNPQMMQQIMSLAQSMGAQQERKPEPEVSLPPIDPGMLQKLAGMTANTGVDQNQRALLRALGPYVSRERVGKLEKAMQAAKMAAFASSLLQSRNGR